MTGLPVRAGLPTLRPDPGRGPGPWPQTVHLILQVERGLRDRILHGGLPSILALSQLSQLFLDVRHGDSAMFKERLVPPLPRNLCSEEPRPCCGTHSTMGHQEPLSRDPKLGGRGAVVDRSPRRDTSVPPSPGAAILGMSGGLLQGLVKTRTTWRASTIRMRDSDHCKTWGGGRLPSLPGP